MKAIYFIAGGFRDAAKVGQAFPSVKFVSVDSVTDLAREIPDAEILFTANSVYEADAAQVIRDKGKALRWIHFKTSGVDKAVKHGLPVGVPVTNSPGLSAPCHAEHAIGMLLLLTRRFRQIDADRARKAWTRREIGKQMVSLVGKTMAVVGFGAIGQAMARYAKAFGMRVVVVSRGAETGPTVDVVVGRDRLGDVLAEADVVAMCTVLTADTRHMIGAKELARMKPDAYLLNVARGDLVDEMAMASVLKAGKLAGAGLDVFSDEPPAGDHPFWTLDNVVMTPHVSGAGFDSDIRATEIVIENLRRYLGKQPLDCVLGPERLTLEADA